MPEFVLDNPMPKKENKEKIEKDIKRLIRISGARFLGDEEEMINFLTLRILELFSQEYKNGYNQRLKDEGKIGERWQHLYL